MKQYYVYILTNRKHGSLYIGFTNDLQRRIYEHKSKTFKGFTSKYNLEKLVYFETALTVEEAQARERKLKHWARDWKIQLIEKNNPEWKDLSEKIAMKLSEVEKIKILFE